MKTLPNQLHNWCFLFPTTITRIGHLLEAVQIQNKHARVMTIILLVVFSKKNNWKIQCQRVENMK